MRDTADDQSNREHPPEVDREAELAVVVGRTAKDVPVARALEHVLGYIQGIGALGKPCGGRAHLNPAPA